MNIRGSKGSSSSSATESADTLRSIAYAKVLDAISEGPIYGLVDGEKSIYLDDTPIANSDGSTNFSNYSVDTRVGTQDQAYLSGFPSVENEISVGIELRADTPWVHAIENIELTAVRIRLEVPALSQTNTTTGDITGYKVDYAIDLSTDGGAYATVLSASFDGKTTSEYERSHRIELGTATTGWTVRVRRITANSASAYIANTTNIEAITEIIDRKFRYPMTALVGMTFDASSFSSVPTRSYDLKGLLVRVPSNYDPDERTYSGTWDGTFKTAWTNNPAWVFYDLVLNDRYGLGKRVDASMVDKWGLYAIAQYCDVMVSDGKNGTEPRFTCNCYIQTRADAYKVLQDIAGIFRGIAYWGAGQVIAGCDMPTDVAYVYTPANVVDGKFSYVGSALSTRYTVCLVTYNDPNNNYAQAVEYVADEDGIARYGVNKVEITAFGTTSQAQAHRLGLWTLLTSRYETGTVTFSVGLDGTRCVPGQVIAVADPAKAGRRIGGRIKSVNGRAITLDKAPTVAAGDSLTVILPTGLAQKRTVGSVDGDTVTVSESFDTTPVAAAIWMLESTDLAAQTFRVVSVQENDDDGQITYAVNAAQYEPGKFAAVDSGAAIQVRPTTVIPPSVQPPPTNVRLSTYSTIDQGISKTTMVIAWDAAASATSYIPIWRKDSGEWVTMNAVGGLQAEVPGIYQGAYLAGVYAVNAMGVKSVPANSTQTTLTGKTGSPPSLVSLTATSQVFAIQLDWAFPSDGTAGDTQYTDIWYSKSDDLTTATRLGTYPYPQATANLMGLAAGQTFFFWGRLVDTTGNIGPWYPVSSTGGVAGQSSADADEILSYLAGQIGQTELAQDLLSQIELIPDLQQTVTDTAAAVTTETQARIDGDTALSERLDEVSAQVLIPEMAGDDGSYAGSTEVYAGVWSEQSARAEADLALAQRIDTTTAQITSNNATLLAAVQTERTARIDADSALATQVTTVQAQADENSAAVQTVAQSYATLTGDLSASYTIKTQITTGGRTYIAGIGVGIDNSSGSVESQVLVTADRFAVIASTTDSSTTVTTPFVIQGGQVFISQALIGTGWITNAMIGDTIQSTALNASGEPYWIITKSGTFTMNGSGTTGALRMNNQAIKSIDANGVVRVQMGNLAV
ncbi:host specificity protein J [Paraburkholderia tropica]|uniref:host specificity protein J n=1 Tax=Paraburkholderia tropica TaxID=92647 RepID=UPI002AB0A3E9|nr:phage tail protein [Paraburkholderia tropica]